MPHSTATESIDSICQEATTGTIATALQMSEEQRFEKAGVYTTTYTTLAPIPFFYRPHLVSLLLLLICVVWTTMVRDPYQELSRAPLDTHVYHSYSPTYRTELD